MAFRTRRGRRKPRVTWMPTFGMGAGIEDEGYEFRRASGVEGALVLNTGDNTIIYDAFPLTFDQSNAATDEDPAITSPESHTLQDLVSGNEWRLRRIVGKFFAAATHGAIGTTIMSIVDLALGFIICKTHDDGSPTTDFNQVNPLTQDSMEDPWIWRRRWLLNPYQNTQELVLTTTIQVSPWFQFPMATTGYGSVMDGPHIDQKTARVIHRSERLFAVVAARNWLPEGVISGTDNAINFILDYRLLGSLRPGSSGNRKNASR